MGRRVQVLTVFGGLERQPYSPLASKLHSRWGFKQPIGGRRLEDAAACNVLGCPHSFLDFPDAVYRQDSKARHLYRSWKALRGHRKWWQRLRGPICREDRSVARSVASHVRRHVREMDAIVFCPMGIGSHVDHLITNECGHILEAAGVRVVYYRDFSYDRGWDGNFNHRELTRHDVKLSKEELDRKILAFSEYRSQHADLFGDWSTAVAYFNSIGASESIFVSRHSGALEDELLLCAAGIGL
jgi:hypothetical protein